MDKPFVLTVDFGHNQKYVLEKGNCGYFLKMGPNQNFLLDLEANRHILYYLLIYFKIPTIFS